MTKNKKPKSGIARLLEIAGKRKGLLMVSGLLAIFHAVLALVPYVLVFYIIDQLLQTGAGDVSGQLLMWAFIAVSASFVLMYASGMASHISAFNILFEMRTQIAEKLGKLPLGYVSSGSSGSFKKILADDVERIELFIAHGIPDIIKAIFLPLLILGFLFTIDWRLALISLFPLIFVFIASYFGFVTPKAKALMRQYHQALEDMNSGIVEFVRAMPVMKIFGQSASEFKKFSHTVNNYDEEIGQWIDSSAKPWGMLMSFINNALLPVLIGGLLFIFRGSLTLPVFFLFLILGVGYIRMVFALMTIGPQITMINQGVKRIDEILFEIKEQQYGRKNFSNDFSLTFNHVNFSYTRGTEVLKDVSFTVPQNSITALVGPSGSGKSTIGQLIARFYDVTSGDITIGGINIKDIPEADLMANIGFVFQDNMMFYQTMYNNISMGMEKTREEVIAAAKIAHCHDFITQLPCGYDTKFGDKGVHLSGGEQQRIQLARVALKDPKILILDEATAFSDPENEHLIMQAFSEIIQNKTVIIIAHRLSTIAEANQIIVLDNGTVGAIGIHQELIYKSTLYNKMGNAHQRAKEFELK
jgi:ATP-binding cassette subfamily B protein